MMKAIQLLSATVKSPLFLATGKSPLSLANVKSPLSLATLKSPLFLPSYALESPLFLPSYAAMSRKILIMTSENPESASFQFPAHNQSNPLDSPTNTPLQIHFVTEYCGAQGFLEIRKTAGALAQRDRTSLELTTTTHDPPPLGPDPNRGPDFPGPPLPSPPIPDVPLKPPRYPSPKPPDEAPPPTPPDKVPPLPRSPVPPDI